MGEEQSLKAWGQSDECGVSRMNNDSPTSFGGIDRCAFVIAGVLPESSISLSTSVGS